MKTIAPPPWKMLEGTNRRRKPRILVIDDVLLVRQRLCPLLQEHGYQTSEAESGEQAIELARQAATIGDAIDLALVDILMPKARIEGIEAARILTHDWRIPCLMLTITEDATMRVAASLAGALGYLVKDQNTGDDVILRTIAAAVAGDPIPDPMDSIQLDPREALAIYQRQRIIQEALARLTPQQRRVADLMREGYTNQEIAEKLVVSIATVNTHVQEILSRLGMNSRRELRPHVLYDSLNEEAIRLQFPDVADIFQG